MVACEEVTPTLLCSDRAYNRSLMSRREILFLSCHPGVASYRYRMRSVFPELEARGWSVREETFEERRYILRTLKLRSSLRSAAVVVLQKIKVNPPEAWMIGHYARHVVLDIDDAVYLRKPRFAGGPAEDSIWRRMKFSATCRASDLVVAGNEELASEASRCARRVEVVPTAIDLERYRAAVPSPDRRPTLVWVGRPENLQALEMIRPAIAGLARRIPDLRLRVVCSRFPRWPEVAIDDVVWSPDAEVEALATADVGIMPLADDAWSRGKCAFKLLQYMAASLPCVASPVGANRDAVVDGVTGFLPPDLEGWERSLELLLRDDELRTRLGAEGRARALKNYSMTAFVSRYAGIIESLAAG